MPLLLVLVGAFIVFILSKLTGGGASLLLIPWVAVVVGVKAIATIHAIVGLEDGTGRLSETD